VCFEDCVCTKLVCGHGVCKSCIKKWYMKGCNDGCPMCRKPIYYRGCRADRQKWVEEKQEERYSESFGALIDGVAEELFETGMQMFFLEDMRDVESTFHVLKKDFDVIGSEGWDSEDIEYEILDEGLYLSRRHMKWFYDDDPIRETPIVWRPAHNFVV
jgi:hypothetical protein